uniref:Uncharacterized protein n=1 Tax=Ditylenchus dipsaci TaxID=166011 RepID=A0A915CNJ1_9BILA
MLAEVQVTVRVCWSHKQYLQMEGDFSVWVLLSVYMLIGSTTPAASTASTTKAANLSVASGSSAAASSAPISGSTAPGTVAATNVSTGPTTQPPVGTTVNSTGSKSTTLSLPYATNVSTGPTTPPPTGSTVNSTGSGTTTLSLPYGTNALSVNFNGTTIAPTARPANTSSFTIPALNGLPPLGTVHPHRLVHHLQFVHLDHLYLP